MISWYNRPTAREVYKDSSQQYFLDGTFTYGLYFDRPSTYIALKNWQDFEDPVSFQDLINATALMYLYEKGSPLSASERQFFISSSNAAGSAQSSEARQEVLNSVSRFIRSSNLSDTNIAFSDALNRHRIKYNIPLSVEAPPSSNPTQSSSVEQARLARIFQSNLSSRPTFSFTKKEKIIFGSSLGIIFFSYFLYKRKK